MKIFLIHIKPSLPTLLQVAHYMASRVSNPEFHNEYCKDDLFVGKCLISIWLHPEKNVRSHCSSTF